MDALADARPSSLFCKTDQRNMAGPLHRYGQLSLMPQAIARNPSGNDAPAFGQKIPQQPDVLEVNRRLIDTESAWLAPLKDSQTM